MDVSGIRFYRTIQGSLLGATVDMFTGWNAYHFDRDMSGKAVALLGAEHKKWDGHQTFSDFYPLTFSDLTSEETSLVVEWALQR